ncbi:hypothetical protein [Paenibacillus sp. NPDC058071]|uniref:hypothetical protein n=1 Tax=Paenibacillus sp. NPDC058071 TaxID=3346326 RepID=UPI0036DCFC47
MKKLVIIGLFLFSVIVLPACSSKGEESNLTLEQFIKAYTDAGVEVDPNEKQNYQAVNAKDGVIFYMDLKPVKIYEFESVKALNKQAKEDEIVNGWKKNGKFALHTSSEPAIEIFNSVK